MKACEVIDSPDKWCQGSMFKDKEGRERAIYLKGMQCCALGAIQIAYVENGDSIERVKDCIDLLEQAVDTSIGDWNDSHTYEEVVAKLKQLDI